ncbi:MAG: hypothetical protein ABF682_11450 [Liquorilactobacillus sp.]|uniref:hypothetical protein n=1 Tax=Liquorilactobacillus sp. TaxID=2767923 RepID=UPI0039EC3687
MIELEQGEIGHFEIEAVIGKRNGSKIALLTLTEQKNRFEIVRTLDAKYTDSVNHAIKQ